MAVLPFAQASVLRNISIRNKLRDNSVRFYWSYPGWWFEDYKSCPWPRTEKERKAAAARYGLREGDYKPVKEDYYGGIGDYPDLGKINYGIKDPYENWSFDKYRRNYGEPVPWTSFTENLPDRDTYTQVEDNQGWRFLKRYLLWFGGASFLLLFAFEFPVRVTLPVKPKQYPYDYHYALPNADPKLFPLTNYTFEPADDGGQSKSAHH